MDQGDWLLIGSVVLFVGPYIAGLVYLAVRATQAHEKEEV